MNITWLQTQYLSSLFLRQRLATQAGTTDTYQAFYTLRSVGVSIPGSNFRSPQKDIGMGESASKGKQWGMSCEFSARGRRWYRVNLDSSSVCRLAEDEPRPGFCSAKPANSFTQGTERDINLRFGLGPFPRGRPTRRYVMRCWAPPLCILFMCGMDGYLGTRQCDVSDSRDCDACEENYPFSRPDRVGEL